MLILAMAPAPADTIVVDGAWLLARHGDPQVVVVQTAGDRSAFDAAHIPGARFLALDAFHGHSHGDQLLPASQLETIFRNLGLRNTDRVVVVGDPMAAALLFVALDYVGHGDRTSVLDGGVTAWTGAGGTLTAATATVTRSAFRARPRADMVVDAHWLAARLDTPTVALLDARSRPEYLGTTSREGLPRSGHIPGARHLEWSTLLQSGGAAGGVAPSARLRHSSELSRAFDDLAAGQGKIVVAYCTVGMRASYVYFVARSLGRDARLYVGSMADWSGRPELPVVSERP